MFDKQIESKEEYERIKQAMESSEIVQKTMKDQINILNQKVNSQTSKVMELIDTKLISLNDNLSLSLGHITTKAETFTQLE